MAACTYRRSRERRRLHRRHCRRRRRQPSLGGRRICGTNARSSFVASCRHRIAATRPSGPVLSRRQHGRWREKKMYYTLCARKMASAMLHISYAVMLASNSIQQWRHARRHFLLPLAVNSDHIDLTSLAATAANSVCSMYCLVWGIWAILVHWLLMYNQWQNITSTL